MPVRIRGPRTSICGSNSRAWRSPTRTSTSTWLPTAGCSAWRRIRAHGRPVPGHVERRLRRGVHADTGEGDRTAPRSWDCDGGSRRLIRRCRGGRFAGSAVRVGQASLDPIRPGNTTWHGRRLKLAWDPCSNARPAHWYDVSVDAVPPVAVSIRLGPEPPTTCCRSYETPVDAHGRWWSTRRTRRLAVRLARYQRRLGASTRHSRQQRLRPRDGTTQHGRLPSRRRDDAQFLIFPGFGAGAERLSKRRDHESVSIGITPDDIHYHYGLPRRPAIQQNNYAEAAWGTTRGRRTQDGSTNNANSSTPPMLARDADVRLTAATSGSDAIWTTRSLSRIRTRGCPNRWSAGPPTPAH